jgi:hypothetical protein
MTFVLVVFGALAGGFVSGVAGFVDRVDGFVDRVDGARNLALRGAAARGPVGR